MKTSTFVLALASTAAAVSDPCPSSLLAGALTELSKAPEFNGCLVDTGYRLGDSTPSDAQIQAALKSANCDKLTQLFLQTASKITPVCSVVGIDTNLWPSLSKEDLVSALQKVLFGAIDNSGNKNTTTTNSNSTYTPVPTTMPTDVKKPDLGACIPVSVVGDATFCISGPICSGSGLLPAGTKCPKKGDAAVRDCFSYLPSASNGKCVAPLDSVCQKISSGAFGCVWPKA